MSIVAQAEEFVSRKRIKNALSSRIICGKIINAVTDGKVAELA